MLYYWQSYNTSPVAGISSAKIYYSGFERNWRRTRTEVEKDKRASCTLRSPPGRESLRQLQQSCVTSCLFFPGASGGCFGAESDEFLYRTGLQKKNDTPRNTLSQCRSVPRAWSSCYLGGKTRGKTPPLPLCYITSVVLTNYMSTNVQSWKYSLKWLCRAKLSFHVYKAN